jgi:hypothetical protein
MTLSTVPYALAVDDDPLILMDARSILEDAGYRCHEADDGDGAIDLLGQKAEQIMLLFSDVEMPGSLDGFELARKVFATWRGLISSSPAAASPPSLATCPRTPPSSPSRSPPGSCTTISARPCPTARSPNRSRKNPEPPWRLYQNETGRHPCRDAAPFPKDPPSGRINHSNATAPVPVPITLIRSLPDFP